MLNTQQDPIIGHNSRMTEQQYAAERAKIASTRSAAGTRWEQELAALFYRSGWAIKKLAEIEGRDHTVISQILRLGQFLAFFENVETSTNPEIMAKLTVGRFVHYWQRTAPPGKGGSRLHDRERFREIDRLIKAEHHNWRGPGGSKPKLPADTSATVIKKCSGPKWRSASQIAAKAEIPENRIDDVLHQIKTRQQHRATVETKRVGKETHYRIFTKDKTVSLEELTEKLAPIIKGLEIEGKKHSAQRVEAEIARLAALLKRLLNEWAE
jgi:hypothetical protein